MLHDARPDSPCPSRPVLIFDLSEVLVGGLFGVVSPVAGLVGQPAHVVTEALGGDPWLAYMEGAMDEEGYWRAVLQRTAWTLDAAELAALVRRSLSEPVAGMADLVARLEDHQLALLSDHGRDWMDFILGAHPFLARFERRFLSFEMGRTKKRPETFHWVVRELGCAAADCVFIDDLAANVERAKEVGMRAIHFRSAEALVRQLARLGISLGERRRPDADAPPRGEDIARKHRIV